MSYSDRGSDDWEDDGPLPAAPGHYDPNGVLHPLPDWASGEILSGNQVSYFKFHSDTGHMPSPIKEPTEAHLSIVGQRWPLEARPTSPASLLDRFFIYDAGGEPTRSRRSSWPACAGMTSVGSASCSRCP